MPPRTPGHDDAYCGPADAVPDGKIFILGSVLHGGTDRDHIRFCEDGPPVLASYRPRPVPQGVSHVPGASVVSQVFQPVVLRVAVVVADLLTGRARPEECCRDQLMYVRSFLVASGAQG